MPLLPKSQLQRIYSTLNLYWQSHPVVWMFSASTIILFASSSLRHALFGSSAWDLGIFDQAVYLISQGQTPISSLMKVHILADHAAFVFYPLALLYKIHPNVHWLLALQAIALASGVIPCWHLARIARLKKEQAVTIGLVYLLFPVIFNTNLFDFHPEVFALPALLFAILSAQLGEVLWFCIAIILILSCKEILGLNVVGLGFWLLVFQKQRTCGAIAIISGMAWFLIDIKLIIPAFVSLDAIGGSTVTVSRYAYAGNSPLEIAKNLLFSPNIVLVKVFSWDNFQYLCLLFLPVIWALSLQHLVPLVGAIPPLALNLLADYEPQKSLAYHYSLTILPFIIVAIIDTFADKQRQQQNHKILILWSVICFFGLARWIYFFTKYLPTIDTWQATREAISYVRTKDGVLASEMIVPHLSQRIEIEGLVDKPSLYDLANYKYVLLNKRHPGINSTAKFLNETITQLKEKPKFKLSYERDEVFVFEKLAEQSTKAAS